MLMQSRSGLCGGIHIDTAIVKQKGQTFLMKFLPLKSLSKHFKGKLKGRARIPLPFDEGVKTAAIELYSAASKDAEFLFQVD